MLLYLQRINKRSNTSLCVCAFSKVFCKFLRYLQSINLVIISVSDLDLNKCASSPNTTPNCSKYFFGNLYKLCYVDIKTFLSV